MTLLGRGEYAMHYSLIDPAPFYLDGGVLRNLVIVDWLSQILPRQSKPRRDEQAGSGS